MTTTAATAARRFAEKIVRRLRAAGYDALFAGGCVRDQMLGRTPVDYDVATSARPDEVREVFGRRRTIAVGASFGVVSVLGPREVGQVEVATFRSDGQYSDGRHPDAVIYSSPAEDARRRDFTINGMFFDPVENQVIDYVRGQADLAARLIRAIGDPAARFREDKLRMLRAVRFASTYAFQIEAATLRAVQQQHAQISSVSSERVSQELERMLLHPNRRRALDLLRQSLLLSHVLPELGPLAVAASARWDQLLRIVDQLRQPTLNIVLCVLWGEAGAAIDQAAIERACRRMRLANETRKSTIWLTRHEPLLRQADRLRFSQLQPLLIHPNFPAALDVSRAITTATGEPTDGIKWCEQHRQWPLEKLNPPPLLAGQDLIELGARPSPKFSRILDALRAAQLDGMITDKAAALAWARAELHTRPNASEN